MKKTVIITAGGIGRRMGSSLPKQFMPLNGKPILLHTIERLRATLPEAQMIITLPEDWQTYWLQLLSELNIHLSHELVDGGNERFHSVRNALKLATGDHVLVHDGVRPLVSERTICHCLDALAIYPAVVPVLPVKESLREKFEQVSKSVDRNRYVLVQTPQCFHAEILINAYNQPYDSLFTDDASVVERFGVDIKLVDGNEENIKITNSSDLKLAEALLSMDDLPSALKEL